MAGHQSDFVLFDDSQDSQLSSQQQQQQQLASQFANSQSQLFNISSQPSSQSQPQNISQGQTQAQSQIQGQNWGNQQAWMLPMNVSAYHPAMDSQSQQSQGGLSEYLRSSQFQDPSFSQQQEQSNLYNSQMGSQSSNTSSQETVQYPTNSNFTEFRANPSNTVSSFPGEHHSSSSSNFNSNNSHDSNRKRQRTQFDQPLWESGDGPPISQGRRLSQQISSPRKSFSHQRNQFNSSSPSSTQSPDWVGADMSPRNPPSGSFGPPIDSLSLTGPEGNQNFASLFENAGGQSQGQYANFNPVAPSKKQQNQSFNAQRQEAQVREGIRKDLAGVDQRALKGQLKEIAQEGSGQSASDLSIGDTVSGGVASGGMGMSHNGMRFDSSLGALAGNGNGMYGFINSSEGMATPTRHARIGSTGSSGSLEAAGMTPGRRASTLSTTGSQSQGLQSQPQSQAPQPLQFQSSQTNPFFVDSQPLDSTNTSQPRNQFASTSKKPRRPAGPRRRSSSIDTSYIPALRDYASNGGSSSSGAASWNAEASNNLNAFDLHGMTAFRGQSLSDAMEFASRMNISDSLSQSQSSSHASRPSDWFIKPNSELAASLARSQQKASQSSNNSSSNRVPSSRPRPLLRDRSGLTLSPAEAFLDFDAVQAGVGDWNSSLFGNDWTSANSRKPKRAEHPGQRTPKANHEKLPKEKKNDDSHSSSQGAKTPIQRSLKEPPEYEQSLFPQPHPQPHPIQRPKSSSNATNRTEAESSQSSQFSFLSDSFNSSSSSSNDDDEEDKMNVDETSSKSERPSERKIDRIARPSVPHFSSVSTGSSESEEDKSMNESRGASQSQNSVLFGNGGGASSVNFGYGHGQVNNRRGMGMGGYGYMAGSQESGMSVDPTSTPGSSGSERPTSPSTSFASKASREHDSESKKNHHHHKKADGQTKERFATRVPEPLPKTRDQLGPSAEPPAEEPFHPQPHPHSPEAFYPASMTATGDSQIGTVPPTPQFAIEDSANSRTQVNAANDSTSKPVKRERSNLRGGKLGAQGPVRVSSRGRGTTLPPLPGQAPMEDIAMPMVDDDDEIEWDEDEVSDEVEKEDSQVRAKDGNRRSLANSQIQSQDSHQRGQGEGETQETENQSEEDNASDFEDPGSQNSSFGSRKRKGRGSTAAKKKSATTASDFNATTSASKSRSSTGGRKSGGRLSTLAETSPNPDGDIDANTSRDGVTHCDYVSPLDTSDHPQRCGTAFHRQYDLARHRETIHGKFEHKQIKAGKLTLKDCVVLGKEVDPAKSEALKEWKCDGKKGCGSVFSRKDALLRHRRLRDHAA